MMEFGRPAAATAKFEFIIQVYDRAALGKNWDLLGKADFWGWEGSFVQNNEGQFQGIGGRGWEKGDLLQELKVFAVFVRGSLSPAPSPDVNTHLERGESRN
jgi:hypothetical protein